MTDGYPPCACGCGERVLIGLHAVRIALLSRRVWYLPGHGAQGAKHCRPYAVQPPETRR
jgi:hypothetical protein